jgi:hypothetical protein
MCISSSRGINPGHRRKVKRYLICCIALFSVFWADAAQAKPKPWVQTTATVSGALIGQAVGGYAGGYVFAAMNPYRSEDGFGIFLQAVAYGAPVGGAIFGTVGAAAGHALAGGDRTEQVALATGITGGASAGLVLASRYTGPAFVPVWGTGATGVVVGMPVAAGVSSHAPKRKRVQLAVTPTLTPKYKGIAVAARF